MIGPRRINALLQDHLPPWLYLQLAMIAYPMADPKRRGSGLRVEERMNGFFVAHLANGRRFWFDDAAKVPRYMVPVGRPYDVFNSMLKKYSGPHVSIEPTDTVMDIGANVGEFTVAAAARATRVIAVDPDPGAFACLRRNAIQPGNVVCVNAAVGDRDGTATLHIASKRSDTSLVRPTVPVTETREVQVKTVATLMKEWEIGRLDLLKIDAEGFEPEVLHGALSVLYRIEQVAIDVSPERAGVSTAEPCRDLLDRHGFMTKVKRDGKCPILLAWR